MILFASFRTGKEGYVCNLRSHFLVTREVFFFSFQVENWVLSIVTLIDKSYKIEAWMLELFIYYMNY